MLYLDSDELSERIDAKTKDHWNVHICRKLGRKSYFALVCGFRFAVLKSDCICAYISMQYCVSMSSALKLLDTTNYDLPYQIVIDGL